MTVRVQTEINLSHLLREEVSDPGDLARLALEALDACTSRFYRAKDNDRAEAIRQARTELTARIGAVFQEPGVTKAPRVVAVPAGCVERPGKRGSRGAAVEYAHLTHAAEVDANDHITALLCKSIKLESLLHDSSMYNYYPVDCPRCLAAMKRRGITIKVTGPG